VEARRRNGQIRETVGLGLEEGRLLAPERIRGVAAGAGDDEQGAAVRRAQDLQVVIVAGEIGVGLPADDVLQEARQPRSGVPVGPVRPVRVMAKSHEPRPRRRRRVRAGRGQEPLLRSVGVVAEREHLRVERHETHRAALESIRRGGHDEARIDRAVGDLLPGAGRVRGVGIVVVAEDGVEPRAGGEQLRVGLFELETPLRVVDRADTVRIEVVAQQDSEVAAVRPTVGGDRTSDLELFGGTVAGVAQREEPHGVRDRRDGCRGGGWCGGRRRTRTAAATVHEEDETEQRDQRARAHQTSLK
jgi:hypothetical protein